MEHINRSDNSDFTDQITMSGDGKYWASYEPFIDENYSNDKGIPTMITRGLFKGYSMGMWSTPANQYEELMFRMRIPFRWDGTTNPYFCAITTTTGAEDIGDKYQFQLEWQAKDAGFVLPDTIAETITSEVTLTDGSAYFTTIITLALDATKLASGKFLQARLRRIAASSLEVTAEPAIWHWCTRWLMNKLGTSSIQGY